MRRGRLSGPKAEADRTAFAAHSAAIYGLRNKTDIQIFILYPYGRVSPIQEAQMATVEDENVHCVAVDGTFDDCQVRENRHGTANLR